MRRIPNIQVWTESSELVSEVDILRKITRNIMRTENISVSQDDGQYKPAMRSITIVSRFCVPWLQQNCEDMITCDGTNKGNRRTVK